MIRRILLAAQFASVISFWTGVRSPLKALWVYRELWKKANALPRD